MLRYAATHQRRIGAASAAVTGSIGFIVLFNDYSNSHSHDKINLQTGSSTLPRHLTKSKYPPIPQFNRTDQVSRLKNTQQDPFDVLVIGGGATGAGTALDAQMRGLSTALIEKGDFSCETSSRSTKLIWAGIKYIATAFARLFRPETLFSPIEGFKEFKSEFLMVMHCHHERRLLLENNPHLTNWVPIAIPMRKWIMWPPPFDNSLFAIAPMVLPIVMKFYDSLSGFTCPPSHVMGHRRAERKFPQLDADLKYTQIFYEGQHNDARTATCIALTAAEEGAAVTNYTEMIGTITDGDDKTVIGIKCRDNLTGELFDIYAQSIIFAGGPFTDSLRKISSPDSQPAVSAAAGTHVVLPRYYAPNGIGMLDMNTSDGRFLFFLPWQGSVLVGTTDRKGAAVTDPGPPEEEIQWILKEVEKYLSDDLKVRRGDVLSAWQGWRPLASDPNAPPGAPVSRDHVISTDPVTGITFITGGKWTTYREMAEDVLNKVIKNHPTLSQKAGPCLTETRPLWGGKDYNKNLPITLIQKYGLSQDTAEHLARTYGMNAFTVCELSQANPNQRYPHFGHRLIENYPFLECEIEYVCQYEMAVSLKDFLTLRTRLAYLNSDAAKEVAPKVCDLMGKSLGWSRAEKKKQLAECMAYLERFGGPIPPAGLVVQGLHTKSDVKDMFKMFDTDGNGYIDFQELKSVAQRLGYPFKDEKEALNAFKKMDVENNGRVSFEAFSTWYEKTGVEDDLRKKIGLRVSVTAEAELEGTSNN